MGKRIHTMDFDKATLLANLAELESVIKHMHKTYKGCSYAAKVEGMTTKDNFESQCYNDLMFVRGLMDDIECDRITEFPLVERTNCMSGRTFLEEPDTPYYCSPSSEAYWSM